MKVQIVRLAAFVAFTALLTFIPASAHEGREVGGYTIEIGWRVEPAYTEMLNGPEIRVSRHSAAEGDHETTTEAQDTHDETDGAVEAEHAENPDAILGLEDTLQIEIIFGPASRILHLEAVFDDPGLYSANVIPMLPGDYTFRVFGTIEGVEVDETFSAADGQFSPVDPIFGPSVPVIMISLTPPSQRQII